MHQSIAQIAALYNLNTQLLTKTLAGIKDEDTSTRPNDKANSANFVAGHTVSSRYSVAACLGLKEECPWGELYGMGAKIKDASEYPSMDEIKKVWADISEKIAAQLEKVDEATLNAEGAWQPPGCEKTNLGIVTFLQFHESYHIGQLAYLGRLLGGEQLFG